MKNIVNIINFVRACEPREKDDSYLFSTLESELSLCREFGFKNTVLLQYDALILPEYASLCREYSDLSEVGLWLEIVEPLVLDSGLSWRGRFPWDWHNDVGFTVGYTPDERKKLIDTAFLKFKEIFGAFPECVGSWHIDAFSLSYMSEKYGIKASCNCRDQYGTDGYTIWGGYYNGAYYPSKKNMLCPANTKENQIDVPVFRMLGSDPVYQYDCGLGKPEEKQGVCTLEPVYAAAGGCREWVEWYFKENFNGKGLSVSYTQVGQENSFGWKKIGKALRMQFEVLEKEIKNGNVELLTLAEAGEYFKNTYEMTPPGAICTDSAFPDTEFKTAWYYSKHYRVNIIYENGRAWLRDMQLFDENYPEPFLNMRDSSHDCGYYNLPVTDGFRFSKGGIRAGLYIKNDRTPLPSGEFKTETPDEKTLKAYFTGCAEFTAEERSFKAFFADDGSYFEFAFADMPYLPYVKADGKTLYMSFGGFDGKKYSYTVQLADGSFSFENGVLKILPENRTIEFVF